MILKNILGDCFAKVIVNVYDINTRKIVFTDSQTHVAHFLKVRIQSITNALKNKSRIKKQYVIRYAKI